MDVPLVPSPTPIIIFGDSLVKGLVFTPDIKYVVPIGLKSLTIG